MFMSAFWHRRFSDKQIKENVDYREMNQAMADFWYNRHATPEEVHELYY